LDAYLVVTTATEAHEVVNEVDRFASRFPKSELAGIAYQYQMRAYKQLNDFDGMLAAGERALLANPDNLNTLLTLAPAMANRAAQRPDSATMLAQAEDYAQRALQGIERTQIPRQTPLEHWELEKQEMQSEAHETLGVVALRRGQFKTAVEEFQTAVRLAPNAQGVEFLGLGMAYASAGASENAEKALRRAVELGPEAVRTPALNELEKLNGKESARQ
jgi:tetratricopeptide (TPR) repeat protein